MCNPLWTLDSYNALTNVVRFKPMEQKSLNPDIYNLMFGLKRPCLRLITVGEDHRFDYLEKAGPISLKHTGKKTMLASDLSAADNTYHQWRFTYNIEYLYRKNRKIDGERVFIPEIFECSLSFLNPRRAHRVSGLSVLVIIHPRSRHSFYFITCTYCRQSFHGTSRSI